MLSRRINVLDVVFDGLQLAGFQVSITGRFWVSTEGRLETSHRWYGADISFLHQILGFRRIVSNLKRLAEAADRGEIGERVGPYRLVRELDAGGMGNIYLAVRSDDHYFQFVALKMVRKGMESLALLQRFRAERQILAMLTRPNIGAILDGGNTEDGRPYLVMEYVEGQPITAASETRGLSIRERIELFRSLCSAVHYAHQKLVIHRDIKPNNVMVTPEGIVKLIDFGISKPLAPDVNNAGCASVAPLLEADIEKMEDMIVLNITALTRLRVRNASPSLLLAQEFLPIFRWAGSTHLTEHTREVLLRFEAASHGDIQHTQVGRAQHLFRTLHSLAQDKPVRVFAG